MVSVGPGKAQEIYSISRLISAEVFSCLSLKKQEGERVQRLTKERAERKGYLSLSCDL